MDVRNIRLGAAIAALLAFAPAAGAQAAPKPSLHVLSNRADMISGGDALVSVGLPRGSRARTLRITLRRRNVTSSFTRVGKRRYQALVTELRVGRNVMRARVRVRGRRRSARVTIIDHANGGP